MASHASAVGLYLHIPFCQRKCPYCGFYSVPVAGQSPDRLIDAMQKEIDLYAVTEPVETIYIGGGSPTCLPPEGLSKLIGFLNDRFGPVAEFTVECNPSQVTECLLRRLRSGGVNRLSIGAQSFDAGELRRLGRLHGPDENSRAVAAARAAGFDNIGLDLIFGLPGSDATAWGHSLDRVKRLNVQHVSAYSLTIEPNTPFERAVQQGELTLIDEALERTMYELARVELPAGGLQQYEISNFARSGYACRHNLRYWHNLPVVGIGPSAAGWYRGRRTLNIRDIDRYCEAIRAGRFAHVETDLPGPQQVASETAILNLRLRDGINRAEFAARTGFRAEDLFAAAIEKNKSLGLLEQSDTRIYLTDMGLSLADTVAEDFVLSDENAKS